MQKTRFVGAAGLGRPFLGKWKTDAPRDGMHANM